MSQDPIGVFGRLNAASLMMITPEFYKLWSKRGKAAGKINHDPVDFAMQPEFMQLDGLKIRYATGGNSDAPTVLFLSPLPQSILCYGLHGQPCPPPQIWLHWTYLALGAATATSAI